MGRFRNILSCYRSHELGFSLIQKISHSPFVLFLIIFSFLVGSDEEQLSKGNEKEPRIEYYKYWNAYYRALDLKGEPQSFYGQSYYQVKYNKDNRIKTVTRIDENREPQETYHLIWTRSGNRSEYNVVFHTRGSVFRLDPFLYDNKLSEVRPGWIAKFTSRKDGRPTKVSFSDKLGFTYFSYKFNYSTHSDSSMNMEVVESSYYDAKDNFVGRHLLFREDGEWLRMIQYYDRRNKIFETREFIHDSKIEETVRIISDSTGKEIERRIIPFMDPGKYVYKFEWTGREVIVHEDDEIIEREKFYEPPAKVTKTYMSFQYSYPMILDTSLANHQVGATMTFGFGVKNAVRSVDIGLDVHRFDIHSDSVDQNLQTPGFIFVAEPDISRLTHRIYRHWDMNLKLGMGFVPPGHGVTAGFSIPLHFINFIGSAFPVRVKLQSEWILVTGLMENVDYTYWWNVGINIFLVGVFD